MLVREILEEKELFVSGHRCCAGCAIPIIVKLVLAAAQKICKNIVVGCATGCLEVCSTIYPFTSWKCPFIHNAFENVAATMSGVERAYRALKKKGKVKEDVLFIAFGGDGGTYDIGLQALSGAAERGNKFLYVCYNNQGYMNTGNQRSSATPYKAFTTTTPLGKLERRKSLVEILASHGIYAAQTSVHAFQDLTEKVIKGIKNMPAYLEVLSPCTTNWKFKPEETIEISKLAVETCFWPLYEIYPNGKYVINYKPKEKKHVAEFLKRQGRFKKLSEKDVEEIQKTVDENWERLLRLEDNSKNL